MENKITKVTCAIIENQGKILVAQRSEKMSLPMKWEFPGGKIEDGELPEECIKREIKEEMDIQILVKNKLKSTIHSYGDKTIELIPFICEIEEGELQLKEHRAIVWKKPIELEDLDWAEADIPIYREYIKHVEGIE